MRLTLREIDTGSAAPEPRFEFGGGFLRILFCLLTTVLLAACAGPASTAPSGPAAYDIIKKGMASVSEDYRIGPLDELEVTVFQEPDLSLKEVKVDASGNITFPLIGQVRAEGRTSADLATEIRRMLGERYLQHPQVSLNVTKSISQTVTVGGEVNKPGVYEIPGNLTLLQAVSLAEGTNQFAKSSEVLVFRTINGQRYAARFDLGDIQRGAAEDPLLRGRDTVVVGGSGTKRAYRDLLQAMPGLAGLFVAVL
jgi:polysaccharide export outer membrane protein